jgi:hypothetical protein
MFEKSKNLAYRQLFGLEEPKVFKQVLKMMIGLDFCINERIKNKANQTNWSGLF